MRDVFDGSLPQTINDRMEVMVAFSTALELFV
jgi:hypothetical protein